MSSRKRHCRAWLHALMRCNADCLLLTYYQLKSHETSIIIIISMAPERTGPGCSNSKVDHGYFNPIQIDQMADRWVRSHESIASSLWRQGAVPSLHLEGVVRFGREIGPICGAWKIPPAKWTARVNVSDWTNHATTRRCLESAR